MCGIAGVVRRACRERSNERSNARGDAEAVRRMLAAQAHRGPDGEGIWEAAGAVMGHRRLSIIDLSEAGRQPMGNEDGSVQVTFNGEIYNHRELREELTGAGHVFQSRTDTEVLAHGYEQWGIDGLLARLRGMFAFALYDVRQARLLLARDRLGIKPLYYHEGPEQTGPGLLAFAAFLAFASEVKALIRSGLVPLESDRSAMAGFLMAGAVPGPRTIVKGIRCLPPGCWAEWKDGAAGVHQYWDLLREAADTAEAAATGLRELLEETVQGHLIGDVPLGVFLSGGVDSAGLVAVASRIRRSEGAAEPLQTLTVVFDEREYSEASQAVEVARRFGTRHEEVRVTSGDFQRDLPAFLAAMDQPTNDGVNSWFVSKAAAGAGLKIVLSGLGGDEVFWGYKHYRRLRFGAAVSACPAPLRRLAASAGYQWGRLRGRDNWMRTAWLQSGGSSDRLYLTMRGFFAPDQVARLMDMTQAETNAAVDEHFGRLGAGAEASARAINYIEVKRYLHDQLLRDTDVFSMAHSIEARVPYLDHALVERLWNTPGELKLGSGNRVNKPLLVDAIGDDSVAAAAARPKRGFTFPMARWMKTAAPEMREMAEAGQLERGAVRECWGDFAQGRMHWSRAWALTVLGAMAA